jgi:hypothetical protein
MNDPVTYLLTLDTLLKNFYEHFNVRNFQRTYEISLDMVDIAQQLEDLAKKLRDANTN